MDVDEIRRRLRAAGAQWTRARQAEDERRRAVADLVILGRAAGLGPTELAELAETTKPTIYRMFEESA